MGSKKNINNNITIDDVASALGVSKTTVSRAISGKGRIGEETKRKVLDYINKHNYRPNVMAKGLAKSKTYNIGWLIPGESRTSDLPFFQKCLTGISETAANSEYDVLMSMSNERNIAQLERIVTNKKVDGVIIGRTLLNDPNIEYLKGMEIPFVVIGSTRYENVAQVDNDHFNACRELTSLLLMKGIRRAVLIGGDSNHVVNQTRKQGFEAALNDNKSLVSESRIYMDSDSTEEINRIVDEVISAKYDCIVCMDDLICANVLNKCQKDGINIPDDIKIASFYDSELLQNAKPGITAIQYDPKELGNLACKTLLSIIGGDYVDDVEYLTHQIAFKGSTQDFQKKN